MIDRTTKGFMVFGSSRERYVLMSKIFSVFLLIIFALTTGCQSNKSIKTPYSTESKNQFGDTQNDIGRICGFSKGNWVHAEKYQKIVTQRGYSCETINSNSEKQRLPASRYSGQMLCTFATSYKYGNVKQWSKSQKDQEYVQAAKKRGLTCGVGSSNQQIAPDSSNSAELKALRLERQQIEANLRAMEELIATQKRAANAPYKSCLANCKLNNRAGSGFAAALSGMGQCNNSCAPLKYGGAVIPPSWERNQRRLKTIDCTITQMSKNQATARCNQF
ncbi:hypothetical protein N9P99_01750 [Planktomarina temperata]|nr:hypothetical protein [Planktomarina temperata]